MIMNPLAIIFLSLLHKEAPLHHHAAATGTGKRVADAGESPVAATV